jgi:hypothetical protein
MPSMISLPRSGAQRKSRHLAPIESIGPFQARSSSIGHRWPSSTHLRQSLKVRQSGFLRKFGGASENSESISADHPVRLRRYLK